MSLVLHATNPIATGKQARSLADFEECYTQKSLDISAVTLALQMTKAVELKCIQRQGNMIKQEVGNQILSIATTAFSNKQC